MEQDILNDYKSRTAVAQQQVDKYKKLADTYSLLRLGIFALMVLGIYLGVTYNNFSIVAIAFAVLAFCFTWLVSRQSAFEKRKVYFNDLLRVTINEINSITQQNNLYDNGQRFEDEKHFYTSDLDVFGSASLFKLINRAATSPGNVKLSVWLKTPADKKVVTERQAAVKELSNKNNWKLDMQTKLLFAIKESSDQLTRLFLYLKTPLNLPGEQRLSIYIKIAPFLLFGAVATSFFFPLFKLAAIVLALFNMFLMTFYGSYILKAAAIADKIGEALANYADVFKTIEQEDWSSLKCKALAQQLNKKQTSIKIAELSVLINKLSYSLIMIVGFILNIFFLWALKQIISIERWKRNNHDNFEYAFDVIAEFEALMSLAVPAINYPDWTYPVISDTEGYTLTAKKVAHPLIRSARVANDYELKDTFSIDIITGSNMAGKSTFLRTVGVNCVLALAGAPVCADAMEVSVIRIVTYMRIKDSLNESTSTFKAELDRLQMLLNAVEHDNRVFFLIDEMLRGTNSVDKYLGSKAVIEQLISKKGVGMVATHDLQIARLEDKHPAYVRNFYFDIQVVNGEMLFDYKIKHGECKTFNASLLLKQIGINVGEE